MSPCNCCGDKRGAFTLAELLVSVLIISIIMVVLAPVLTKRAAMGDFGIGGGSGSGSGQSWRHE